MAGTLVLETPHGAVPLDRTRLMGVVNVTPDSFSDGGQFFDPDTAVQHGLQLAQAGADILDVGGQSARPGSLLPVTAEEEARRVVPVIRQLRSACSLPISVDTYVASVAEAALDAGASIVNDVTALRGDPAMARLVARRRVPLMLMHALWPPQTMQDDPHYVDVVDDVLAFLEERARFAMAHGISREMLLVDPGIGFGKTLEHNLELLRGLPQMLGLGYPLVVGPSRKTFIGTLTGKAVHEREWGTAGAVALCAAFGAHVVRVHDVGAMKDVVRLVDAVIWHV